MPTASPEVESAVNLDSLRLKVYLEFLNGSIRKSADVTPPTINDSRWPISFSWDPVLQLHRQFCMACLLLEPIY